MKTIKDLREGGKFGKLTQHELGDKLGVSSMTVYNWERGAFMPSVKQARAIAELFDISMDDVDWERPSDELKKDAA